jgi:phage-related protein
MGQTLKVLRSMPEDVKDEVGFALDAAQKGSRVQYAVRMKGDLHAVMEIRIDDDGNAYRTMYTSEMKGIVYVLDVFKKKSKAGIATPARDLERIRDRLRRAREHFRAFTADDP